MSKISLKHSGGNVVSLNSPTSAPTSADVAFKLPNQDGSANEVLKTDGSGNLSFGAGSTATSKRTIGSSVSLSSQTYVDFTSFGTVTRFDILVNALSCANDTNFGVQIGTGGTHTTSGYIAQSGYLGDSSSNSRGQTSFDYGFYSHGLASASYSINGIFRFFNIGADATPYKYYCSADLTVYSTPNLWAYIKGYKTLSGAIDIIRFKALTGTFDSGNVRLVTYAD